MVGGKGRHNREAVPEQGRRVLEPVGRGRSVQSLDEGDAVARLA